MFEQVGEFNRFRGQRSQSQKGLDWSLRLTSPACIRDAKG
jgi:hypothetical protein